MKKPTPLCLALARLMEEGCRFYLCPPGYIVVATSTRRDRATLNMAGLRLVKGRGAGWTIPAGKGDVSRMKQLAAALKDGPKDGAALMGSVWGGAAVKWLEDGREREAALLMLEIVRRYSDSCRFSAVGMLCPCIVGIPYPYGTVKLVMRRDGERVELAHLDHYLAKDGKWRDCKRPKTVASRDALARRLYRALERLLADGAKDTNAIVEAIGSSGTGVLEGAED